MTAPNTARAQERVACTVLSQCEPNLRALLIADLASGDPARTGIVAWLNQNGSLDDFGRICAPSRIEPAPMVFASVAKKPVKTETIATPAIVSRATTRTRYPCRDTYVPDADKPDESVYCGKFHAANEPHGKNREIRRSGFNW